MTLHPRVATIAGMNIADIVRRLRPHRVLDQSDAAAAAAPPEIPPDEAGTALADLDAARADTRQALEAAQRRRRQVLLSGAPDAEITKLDRDIDRLHLDLERADELEPVLIDAVQDAALQARRDSLTQIFDAYRDVLNAFGDAMQIATACHDRMVGLREHASVAGHANVLGWLSLPSQLAFDRESINRFVVASVGMLREAPLPTPRPTLFPIRFVTAISLYRTGEVAGFSATDAWRYVKAGVATWEPGTRIPPIPPDLIELPAATPDGEEAAA